MITSPTILQIALPTPLHRLFDYLPPSIHYAAEYQIGSRVQVNFAGRKLIGVLVAIKQHSEVPIGKLKAVEAVLDEQSLWPASISKLLHWAAEYYLHPLGEVLNLAMPKCLREGQDPKDYDSLVWQIIESNAATAKQALSRSKKQQQAYAWLQQHQTGLSEVALKNLDINKATLHAIRDKGLIQQVEPKPNQAIQVFTADYDINAEQQVAIQQLQQQLNHFAVHLLQGVTGSGKTEVYLNLIASTIQQGKQALILVPEIGLTPQTYQRFAKRFSCDIAMLHSGLNKTERMKSWLAAKKGLAAIVIGTRSSIFTPLLNPGLIIIDEEHDLSYKQQDGFRYSARDLAVKRAQLENIPVVLGSATPSLETLANVKAGHYQSVYLNQRVAGKSLPKVHVLDLKRSPLIEGMGQELIKKIKQHVDNHGQVLLFLNRRGYSPVLMCHDCGWLAECDRCDARYTYHAHINQLSCHHCDKTLIKPKQCPSCKSQELIPIGAGTQRLEQALQQQFAGTAILRIDRDSTRKKNAMQEYTQAIKAGEYPILIGTQMLAKGHHFPNLTLVAILDIDSALYSLDFRAPERLAQLLTQVAGRAGRSEKTGEVLLQTHHPEHPLLQTLLTQGFAGFAEQALEERQQMSLPPYQYLALIRAESIHQQDGNAFLQMVKNYLPNNLNILGPIPSSMEKKAGRYRFQLLIRSENRSQLHHAIKSMLPQIEKNILTRKVRWSIDIDPQDMS